VCRRSEQPAISFTRDVPFRGLQVTLRPPRTLPGYMGHIRGDGSLQTRKCKLSVTVVAASLGYCPLHVRFMIANRFPLFMQDATAMRSVNKQHFDILVNMVNCLMCNSEIGKAAGYVLDGPGIESRWEARFSELVQAGVVAHPASYTVGTGSFPGIKRPGRGVYHPPHLVPRLK